LRDIGPNYAGTHFESFLNLDGNNHNYADLEMNARNRTWDLRR